MTGRNPGGPSSAGGPGGSGGSGGSGGGMVMAGPTVGVTPDAVGRLAASLDQAVSTAGTVSQAIARIRDRATAAEMSVGQPDPGAISGLIGGLFGSGSEPDGGALRTLMQQAPPVAKEIRARLNHFLACERDNLPISPSLWFTGEPLPDAQKIRDAVAYFNAHIGDSGGFLWSDPAQGAQEVLNNWKQLTPSELDAVLNSLTPDQLKKLNGQLGEGSSWWAPAAPTRTSRPPSPVSSSALQHLTRSPGSAASSRAEAESRCPGLRGGPEPEPDAGDRSAVRPRRSQPRHLGGPRRGR